MNESELRLERLEESHDLADFDSGNEELNVWLSRHGLAAQRMDSARTFAAVRGRRVLGYFSLTMGSVQPADAPARLVRGMPACPIGMVLLARLAVDRSEQGRGLGGRLLADVSRRAVIADESAARLMVVDAIDDAAVGFYQHDGLIPTPEHPQRLYRRISDIRASLG